MTSFPREIFLLFSLSVLQTNDGRRIARERKSRVNNAGYIIFGLICPRNEKLNGLEEEVLGVFPTICSTSSVIFLISTSIYLQKIFLLKINGETIRTSKVVDIPFNSGPFYYFFDADRLCFYQ
jgi:hypothetical protein